MAQNRKASNIGSNLLVLGQSRPPSVTAKITRKKYIKLRILRYWMMKSHHLLIKLPFWLVVSTHLKFQCHLWSLSHFYGWKSIWFHHQPVHDCDTAINFHGSCFNPHIFCSYSILVGGIPTPLKTNGVRQLGWWHSQYMEKKNMFQSPPTRSSSYSHCWFIAY